MNIKEIVHYFETHKNADTKGAGLLAKITRSSREDVVAARAIYRGTTTEKQYVNKVLIFDIETAPMKAYVWRMWKESVTLDQLISDWFVICWSAKWLGEETIMGDCLTPEEVKEENDKRIVEKLWKLFNEADVIIAHNIEKFDAPKMNVRFLHYDLVPPSPYRMVDTLKVAKKQFKFSSNKLDALAEFFGLPRKLETDFTLWKECLSGKKAALDYMFKYNKYDVALLEKVYLKLLPWIHNHPNMGVNSDKLVCSSCGHTHLIPLEDHYYQTQVGTYKVYRCEKCGALSRGRVNIGPKVQTISIAR